MMRFSACQFEGEDRNDLNQNPTVSNNPIDSGKMASNNKKTIDSSGVQLKAVCRSDSKKVGQFVPLTVVSITDDNKDCALVQTWDDIRNKVLALNSIQDIPWNCSIYANIGSDTSLPIDCYQDFSTALKVAEMFGQHLDVEIKPNNPIAEAQKDLTLTGAIPKRRTQNFDDQLKDQNQVEHCNGKAKSIEETEILINKEEQKLTKEFVEELKKEIANDVSQSIIRKLMGCLSQMLISEPNDNKVNLSEAVQEKTEARQSQNRKSPDQPLVVHEGITCDNCEGRIEGIRYKCSGCPDYDLCEACEKMGIHEDHTFLKIKKPIKRNWNRIQQHGNDIYLALDVDLPTGTVNISDANVIPKTSDITLDHNYSAIPLLQQAPCFNKKEFAVGQPLRGKFENKMKKIAKRLEKNKYKVQLYTNLLQRDSEERSAKHEKSSSGVSGNQANVAHKALFLSGMLVSDETVPEGTRVAPGTKFKKTWKVRNTGTKIWSAYTTARYVWGNTDLEPFGKATEIQVPPLKPGEEGRISIGFTAPKVTSCSFYQSHWRLHHRGQPFGQRLFCRVIVDPSLSESTIIRSQKHSNKSSKQEKSEIKWLDLQEGKILRENKTINKEVEEIVKNDDKVVKEDVKSLEKALTAVKEIRFKLNDDEPIPMKSNVLSHTTTPANTPFNVSPPKSPEPLEPKHLENENANSHEFNQFEKLENQIDFFEEKKDEEEKDQLDESDSIFSLSSYENESSDEFVVVPLPRCFDLNVPFNGDDVSTPENEAQRGNDFDDLEADGIASSSSFEVMNNVGLEERNENTNPKTLINEEISCFENPNSGVQIKIESLQENLNENKKDVNENENRNDKTFESSQTFDNNGQKQETTSQPSRPSHNQTKGINRPFNETENIIHVLPESIVTGALAAAAHVYNNARAFFHDRNEFRLDRHESRPFPWVTSPPPAAIPLPAYWPTRGCQREQGMNEVQNTCVSNNNVVGCDVENNGNGPVDKERLTSLTQQLYDMGFWNEALNKELLVKNNCDVNKTVEDLLSPSGRKQRRRDGVNQTPIVRQPSQDKNPRLVEFD